jgi:uncharacterized integral membrane protein (TIGR00698 family)
VRVSPAWLPGLLLAATGAAVAFGIHSVVPAAPWLTAALVLGVIVGCVPALRPALGGVFAKGLTLSSKRLLRLGIVLLGLKLSLGDIGALGPLAIIAIVLLVLLSFAITWSIGRLFRLEGDQPILLAAGFSICGVSAIGAVSAARNSPARDTGTPVALVTLYGTAAIVVLPALAPILGLDASQFGHWVGASVHDVGQVVATAQTGGTIALSAAVIVKLTRVLTLAPMVAIISLVTRRRQSLASQQSHAVGRSQKVGQAQKVGAAASTRPPIVPLFIVGFIALVLVRSFLTVPQAVLGTADLVQTIFIAMALFAIGASLRLETLARSGVRSLAAGLTAWTVILVLALGFVWLVSAV